MKSIFESHPVSVLKKEISKTNIKGYSKMKKDEVVKLMLKHESRFRHIKMKEKKPVVKKAVKKAVKPVKKYDFGELKDISSKVKKTKDVKPKKKEVKKEVKPVKKEEKKEVKKPKWTMKTILKQNDKEEKVYVKEAKKNKNALWFSIPLKNIMLKIEKLEKEKKQETNEYIIELDKLLKFLEKNEKNGDFVTYYYPFEGKTLKKEAERIEKKDENDEELTEYERKMYTLIVDGGEDGIDYSDFYRKTVPFGLQLDNKHDKEFNDNASTYDYPPIKIMIRQIKEMIKKIKEDIKPKK